MSTGWNNSSRTLELQSECIATDDTGYLAFGATLVCFQYAWSALSVPPKHQHGLLDLKAVVFLTAIFAWRTVYSIIPEPLVNLALVYRGHSAVLQPRKDAQPYSGLDWR